MNPKEGTLYLQSFSPTTEHNYTRVLGELLRAGWPPWQWVRGTGDQRSRKEITPWEVRLGCTNF